MTRFYASSAERLQALPAAYSPSTIDVAGDVRYDSDTSSLVTRKGTLQEGQKLAIVARLRADSLAVGLEEVGLAGDDESAHAGFLVDQRIRQIGGGELRRSDPVYEQLAAVVDGRIGGQRKPDEAPQDGQLSLL